MLHRALALPKQAGKEYQSVPTTNALTKAVTLGIALRYLAARRVKSTDPRPAVQRPKLHVVT